jgi:hypothetical protein
MLRWLDGRNNSHFSNLAWNGNTLSFSIRTVAGARDLQAMIPIPTGRQVSSVTANGNPVAHASAVIKGVPYLFIMANTATYQVVFSQTAASMTPGEGMPWGSTGRPEEVPVPVSRVVTPSSDMIGDVRPEHPAPEMTSE